MVSYVISNSARFDVSLQVIESLFSPCLSRSLLLQDANLDRCSEDFKAGNLSTGLRGMEGDA